MNWSVPARTLLLSCRPISIRWGLSCRSAGGWNCSGGHQKQKDDINALNKDVKPEDVPASDKDRIADLDRQLADLGKKERDLLAKYGSDNKVVGQLIDLALLSNGLLKGEALHKFLKRSVDLIK